MAAQQQIDLIIKARADVAEGFARIQNQLDQLGNSVKKNNVQTSELTQTLGKWAAGYLTIGTVVKAAGIAVQFLSDSLKSQSEHVDAVNQLNLALANQGKFTKATSDALVDYAAKIQATTTFNDEAVVAAESLLVTFGLNEAQIKRTTAAAADLSARTGKDLTESAQLLGKAFVGNTAALGKLGFQFTDGASKAQKFEEAVSQVEQRFGGAAATATRSFEGQLKQLANAWDEVKEATGLALGALFSSDKQFGTLIQFLTDLAQLVGRDLPLGWALLKASLIETASAWGIFDSAAQKAAAEWEARLIRAKAYLAAVNYGKFTGSAPPNSSGGGGGPDRDLAEEKKAAEALKKLWEATFKAKADAYKRAGDMETRIRQSVADREEVIAQRQADREEQRIQDTYDAQAEATERWLEGQEEAIRQAEEDAAKLEDAWRSVADALANAGDSIGGFLGGILQLGAGAIQVFENLKHQAETTAEKVAAVANAINAAVGAFQSGSAFKGALGGAAAGAAFGGIGAVIGGIAGGLLGLLGKAKQDAEAVRQLRQQLIETYGSMEALQKKAQQLGVDISLAFKTNDPKLLQGVINLLNQAIEDQKKRIEGLATATAGLDKMTAAWAENLSNATVKNGAAFRRLGTYALATFAGIVKETGNAIAALEQIGPSLDRLIEAQKKFGLEGSAALNQLLAYRQFFVDNKAIADSLSGLTDIMAGLDAAGIHSQELFNAFGKDLVSIFNQMQAKGLGATQALAFMQPQLQQLWEAQRDFGLQTDAATQALLNQAEQQGLVGENMRSVNDKILTVLVAIADVLGATLPESLNTMANAAEREFARFKHAAENAGKSIPNVPGGGGEPGGGNPYGRPEGNAYGNAYIPASPPYGRVTRVGEREGEHILTNPQLENAIARGVAMAGGRSGGGGAQAVTVNLTLDGRVLARVIAQQSKDGRIRVHPASVKGF